MIFIDVFSKYQKARETSIKNSNQKKTLNSDLSEEFEIINPSSNLNKRQSKNVATSIIITPRLDQTVPVTSKSKHQTTISLNKPR